MAPGVALLHGLAEPLRVLRHRASDNTFQLLGVDALHGRLLQPGDDDPAQPLVTVVSFEMWRDRFGSDPELVGRSVTLDGEPHVVAGVLPPDFVLPRGNQRLQCLISGCRCASTQDQLTMRRSNYLQLSGRLRPGISVAEADGELKGVMNGIASEHPELEGEQVRGRPSARGVGQGGAHTAAGPARLGCVRAADRGSQRRRSAVGSGRGATRRAGGAGRARRRPGRPDPTRYWSRGVLLASAGAALGLGPGVGRSAGHRSPRSLQSDPDRRSRDQRCGARLRVWC